MLQILIDSVHSIPYWALVTVPAVLIALITYVVTHHNWQQTIAVSGIFLSVAWGVAAIHRFEVFIHAHYIGSFDQSGFPTHMSVTGWPMLQSAWPIWVTSAIAILALGFLILFLLKRFLRHKLHLSQKAALEADLGSVKNIAMHFEISNLKAQVKTAERALQKVTPQGTDILADAMNEAEKIKQLKSDVRLKERAIKTLNTQLKEQKNEFMEMKILAETLLEERLSEFSKITEEDK